MFMGVFVFDGISLVIHFGLNVNDGFKECSGVEACAVC